MAFKKKTAPEATEELPEVGLADAADAPTVENEDAPAEASMDYAKPISALEKAKITKRAEEQVRRELHRKEAEAYLAKEVDRLREQAGVAKPSTLGGMHDELVTFALDLGYEGTAFLQLNQPHGKCYFHGVTYTEPRHIYNTLNDIAFRGNQLKKYVKGESPYRNREYNTVVSGKGANQRAVH